MTGEHISKGDFVVEYVGELVSAAEADRRSTLCPEAGTYHFQVPSGRTAAREHDVIIDAYTVRNVAAFINFSCEPNLEARPIAAQSGDPRLNRVGFFATRDVVPGEELSYRRDKNAFTKKSREGALRCLCGSAKCIGVV